MSGAKAKLSKLQRYAVDVSPAFAAITLAASLDERRHQLFGTPYCKSIFRHKDEIFQSFLHNHFSDFIDSWESEEETAVPFKDCSTAPIWICWLQGEENAPPLVSMLLNQTRFCSKSHPVFFVSLSNVNQYIAIDNRITELFNNQMISSAQMSDIIRIGLLEAHGGCWLDASVLLTRTLPDRIFSQPCWNAKNIDPNFPLEPKCLDITMWEGYFLAAQPHSLLFRFIQAAFEEYYAHFNSTLDYLLINHFAKIGREEIPAIAEAFSKVPSNNTACELLGPILERSEPEQYHNVISQRFQQSPETFVYKLSTRASYALPDNVHKLSDSINSLLHQCDSAESYKQPASHLAKETLPEGM
jgi:hypothetical protein